MFLPGDPIGMNPDHPLNLGLRGWWLAPPDAAGTTWHDLAGVNRGTLLSGSTSTGWRASHQRFARLLLDGTASYASLPAAAGVMATKVFTWSCWIATASAVANATYIGEGNSGVVTQLFQLRLDQTTGTHAGVGFRDNANVTVTLAGTRVVTDGAWHHIVTTCDGSTSRLYVDGILDTSASVTTLGSFTLDRVSVGCLTRTTNGNFYGGSVDDVRCYPRSLSAGDVADLYLEGLAGNPDALLWRPPSRSVMSAVVAPSTATLTGPSGGTINAKSSAFTVTLDRPAGTGGVVVMTSSTGSSDTFSAT